jgi:[calcium/calmodulin-dependent protein kinase] kinase
MADEEHNHLPTRATTLTLPLRPRVGARDTMASTVQTAIPPSLVSPGIQVEFHGDPNARPATIYPR